MKAIYLIPIIMLFQLPMIAGGVPDAVRESFRKSFPNASGVKWSQEGANLYEAEFKMNGGEVSALYDKDGTLKETEIEIKATELPAPVIEALKRAAGGRKIREAARIVRAADQSVVYEAAIRKGFRSRDLLFDASGNPIK